MYSFYGGQKGQDFKISHIFSNREIDLLRDLEARWYSSVNVGDYVFINYGDISKQDIQDGDNVVLSNYNKNLTIDLALCGRSYNNSIWQKIYLDQNRETQPDLINNDNNVYIYLNFEDTTLDLSQYKKEEIKVLEEVLEQEENAKNKLKRGYSLKETSNLYAEEHFGFAYKLIACVTGKTPIIQVESQTIDIEDGEPYVKLNLKNIEKPILTFYNQRAQRIKEVITNQVGPLTSPLVAYHTNDQGGSLTQPILEFDIPRAAQYYSGYLFGDKDGILTHKFATGDLNIQRFLDEQYISLDYSNILEKYIISQALYNTLSLDEFNNMSITGFFEIFQSEFYKFQDQYSNFLKRLLIGKLEFNKIGLSDYYANLYYLLEDQKISEIKETDIGWGFYGFNKQEISDYNNLVDYFKAKYNQLNFYFSKVENELKKASNVNLIELEKVLFENNFFDENLGLNKNVYSLLTDNEKINYLKRHYYGWFHYGSLGIILPSIISSFIPGMDLNLIFYNIVDAIILDYDNTVNINSYISITERNYLLQILNNIINSSDKGILYHYQYILKKALPGDIYINNSTGRIYQILNTVFDDVNLSNNKIDACYLGVFPAPAPSVQVENINAFNENKEINQITLGINNIYQSTDLSSKPEYKFVIPKIPEFSFDFKVDENIDEVEASTERNDNTQSIEIKIPKGKISTTSPLKIIKVLNLNIGANIEEAVRNETFDSSEGEIVLILINDIENPASYYGYKIDNNVYISPISVSNSSSLDDYEIVNGKVIDNTDKSIYTAKYINELEEEFNNISVNMNWITCYN